EFSGAAVQYATGVDEMPLRVVVQLRQGGEAANLGGSSEVPLGGYVTPDFLNHFSAADESVCHGSSSPSPKNRLNSCRSGSRFGLKYGSERIRGSHRRNMMAVSAYSREARPRAADSSWMSSANGVYTLRYPIWRSRRQKSMSL